MENAVALKAAGFLFYFNPFLKLLPYNNPIWCEGL